MTSLLAFKSKFSKVFKAENHSAFSYSVSEPPVLLMATMYAGDRTEVELDYETLALLKLFREKKLENTSDCLASSQPSPSRPMENLHNCVSIETV